MSNEDKKDRAPSQRPGAQPDRQAERRAVAHDAAGPRKKFHGSARGGAKRQSLTEEIISLDDELIRLLAKRSMLTTKIRGGKQHAATPGAIRNEKAIRSHWEAEAGKISRDSRFIRQLFNLIQDIAATQREDATPGAAFNLAPSRLPVSLDLPGPSLACQGMLWAALAAACGRELRLEGVQRSDAVMDLVKAFSQAGAGISWAGADARSIGDRAEGLENQSGQGSLIADSLSLTGSQALNLANKSIFVGEDPLVFYLLTFLALNRPGKTRFTAGHALKSADLNALYRMLPDLGARLAFAVPGSRGLPASVESSGELPELYVIPDTLPLEGILALLLAAFAWRRPMVLGLDNLPGSLAHQALSIMQPFFELLPEAAEVIRSEVHYNAWHCAGLGETGSGPGAPRAVSFPTAVRTVLDPTLCCMALSLPFFTGGSVKLSGKWPEVPQAPACISLLRLAGLKVELEKNGISAARHGNIALSGGLLRQDLPAELLPLFWVMNASIATRLKGGLLLPHAPETEQGAADLDLARDFLFQVGVDLQEEPGGLRLTPLPQEEAREAAARTHGWSSPGAYWTMALSLGAFFRSNLKISNPDSVTDLLPGYWTVYNALPDPRNAKTSAPAAKPERRRIVTGSVITPPELPDGDQE